MTDQDTASPPSAVLDPTGADLAAAVTVMAERALAVRGRDAGNVLVAPPDPHHGWSVSLAPRRADAARVHVDAVDGQLVLTVGRAWIELDTRDPAALLARLEQALDAVLDGRVEEAVTGPACARIRTTDGVLHLGASSLPWRLRRRRSWSAYAPA